MNKLANRFVYKSVGIDDMYNIWHRITDGAEIIYVHEGEGSVVFRSGVYPMMPRTLYYIGEGIMHYTLPERSVPYTRSKMLLDSSALALSGVFFEGRESAYARLPDTVADEVERLLSELNGVSEASEMRTALVASLALRLLYYIYTYKTESRSAPDDPVSAALAYINANIGEDITLDGVCEAAHIGKYYLCHRFKVQMGVTVMEYLQKTRIELARALLSSVKKIAVSEVSEKSGFGNLSHFCKVFKRETGKTPMKYRNESMRST